MVTIFTKEEEKNQVVSALMSINELINNGLFGLDEDTEHELLKCGVIEMDVEEMQLCLDNVISIIKHLPIFTPIKKEGSE